MVQKREVPPEVVTKYSRKVASLEGDITAILQEERVEKELRTAEMQAGKAENLIKHHKEIAVSIEYIYIYNSTHV